MQGTTAEQRAHAYFRQGFSCAQSTFAALAPLTGIEPPVALKLASAFGAGLGRMRGTCGAFSALCMAAGLRCGNTEGTAEGKERIYSFTRDLAAEFRAEFGTLLCRELLHLPEGAEEPARPEERTAAYYAARPCERCIAFCARRAEQILLAPTDHE